jgi:hypothetical protein
MSFSIQTKVSIRLLSGGHSFSASAIDQAAKSVIGDAVVEIVTPKTTLVPAAVFRAEVAVDCLAMVGLAPSIDEVVVFSPEVDDRVAVMAINKACFAHLSLVFGDAVTFVSPLIMGRVPKDGVLIELVDSVLYVRIFNGGMLFGEAIEAKNDADLLFAIESINKVYHIYNMRVRAKGDVARLKLCFKNLFTNLECE